MVFYDSSTGSKATLCIFLTSLLLFFALPEQYDNVPGEAELITQLIRRILEHAEALLPKVEDVKAEQMGDMIDHEMQQTTDAIEKAAKRIAVGF